MEQKTNSCSIEQNLKERLTPEQYQVCMCSATELLSAENTGTAKAGTFLRMLWRELFASEPSMILVLVGRASLML